MGRKEWVPWVQKKITGIGLRGKEFDGFSARKGGADSLRLVDTPKDVVRKMGRWSESSFMHETYQAVSSRELAEYTSRMASIARDALIAQGKGELMDGEFDSTGIFVEEQAKAFIRDHQKWEVSGSRDKSGPGSLKLLLKRI